MMGTIYSLYLGVSSSPLLIVLVLLVIGIIFLIITDDSPYPGVQIVGRRKYEFCSLISKCRFLFSAKGVIEEGLRNVRGSPWTTPSAFKTEKRKRENQLTLNTGPSVKVAFRCLPLPALRSCSQSNMSRRSKTNRGWLSAHFSME
jgi:hypothetical protein